MSAVKAGKGFLQCALGLLPLLISSRDGLELAVLAGFVVAGSLLLLSVFFLLGRVLPGKAGSLALLVFAAVLAQTARDIWGVPPFWMVSMLILLPDSFRGAGPSTEAAGSMLRRLGGFLMLVLMAAVFYEFGRATALEPLVNAPAGIFILLALAAVLWQNKSGRCGGDTPAGEGGS